LVDGLAFWLYNKHIDKQERTMIKLKDIREGSVVIVRGNFGSGPEERVKVEEVHEDVKNGRPGIDYEGSWAYLTQVQRVVIY
jgi:hypothetical protein